MPTNTNINKMICAIIPCNNTIYLSKILDSLKKQNCHAFVVFDRIIPTVETNSDITVLQNTTGTGFLAGKCRDIGLAEAIKKYDKYIFIDDDCIPQQKLVESHNKILSINEPICTVGKRLEKKYGWKDKREYDQNMFHLDLFKNDGALISNTTLLNNCLITWSCNMGLNKKAVDRLYKFNNIYFNENRIFNSKFDEHWGGEDSFLGIVAWITRILIQLVPFSVSGVMHMEHPRPNTEYNLNHKNLFDFMKTDIIKKCTSTPFNWKFFY